MRILIIEDNERLGKNILKILNKHDFSADLATTGEDGKFKIETEEFDLIILDNMLPDISGPQILEEMRNQQINTPVLMLTAKSQIEDKLESFEKGADDYLTKPFIQEELIARIKALSRRIEHEIVPNIIKIEDLSINLNSCRVEKNGKIIQLSPKEYAILEFLAKHKNQAIDRLTLMSHVWGEDIDPMSNTIDVHIRYLRKKIDDNSKNQLIQTVKGKGYMLCQN